MHLQLTLAAEQGQSQAAETEKGGEAVGGTDQFERLPDAVAMLIFNYVGEIKTLGRCCAVCHRFQALIRQVDNVLVKVDCVISGDENPSGGGSGGAASPKGKGVLTQVLRFVVGSIVKPLQALQHLVINPKKLSSAAQLAEISHHSPSEVLRNFREIQRLKIELPGGELGIEEGVLLKWKAEFGSTLHSCVILGAYTVKNSESNPRNPKPQILNDPVEGGDEGGGIPESFYTNGGLKLRVVWTISSLIAASARHYLLQQIIADHRTLESLVLTDSDGQGVLCMSKIQLEELREKPLAACASANRTQVPALNIKLWYAPHLELPDGTCFKGATLVAIHPSESGSSPQKDGGYSGFIGTAFEEPYRTAAALLVRRRTYLLEMNSF